MSLNILKLRKKYQLSKIFQIFDNFPFIVLIIPDALFFKENNKFTFLQLKVTLIRVFLKRSFFNTKLTLFPLRSLLKTTVLYIPFKIFDLNIFLSFSVQNHLGLFLYSKTLQILNYLTYTDLMHFVNFNFNLFYKLLKIDFSFFFCFILLLFFFFFFNCLFFPFCLFCFAT